MGWVPYQLEVARKIEITCFSLPQPAYTDTK